MLSTGGGKAMGTDGNIKAISKIQPDSIISMPTFLYHVLQQAADHVESATDYQYIRLGDAKQYLLPVHAETLTCQRGSDLCSRNTIDFRNYRKYSGESTITFDAPKEVKK